MSLSTLSVSSGSVSSRGSLGSLASLGSTGSLASLSLTDIYMQGMAGYQVTNTSLQDLYKRVENLLQGHSNSISPSSSVSTSSQQGINVLTGSTHHVALPAGTSSASTSGAHSQSSLDNLGSNASSNTQLNKATGGSLENMVELSAALSSSPFLRRVASGELLTAGSTTTAAGVPSPAAGHVSSPAASPPVSPLGLPPPPPSYEQHVRQRMMGEEPHHINDNHHHHPHPHHPQYHHPMDQNTHAMLINRPFSGTNNSGGITLHSGGHRGQHYQQTQQQHQHHYITPQLPLTETTPSTDLGLGNVSKRTIHDVAMDAPLSNPPLSPISESSSGVCNNLSGGNTRSVSAAVSDESVAGDSGVFEVSIKK